MIYYKLDKEISVEKLVKDIGALLSKQSELQSKVLIVSIQKISDYAGDSLIPKITYKGDSLT